ncbi:Proline-rich protein [Mycena venus]|uniref:Proline-rich protein n=1 Tax=Mycena venus TaxID=2733690 RepID=A0A8H7CHS3_9AGAR|nr:Proline-rich protein [Mycena venus]
MKSIISLTFCVTAALLSTASPLGDRRVLSRKHNGAPLARRFVLSSRFDAPAACAANPVPTGDSGNATTIPDPSTPDNSTVTGVPIAGDNSTVSDTPVDANATTPADNSTVPANSTDANTKRSYGSWNFDDTWFDLCMNSGGDLSFGDSDPCFDYGIDGFTALFADADVCAQQDIADEMITFAKSFGLSINTELHGIWNEQPEGVTSGLYGGPNYPIIPFGEEGSCPYGQFPDVTSCSCVSNFYGSTNSIASATATETATETATASAAASTESSDASSDDSDSSDDSGDSSDDSDSSTESISASAAPATATVSSVDSPDGISGNINDPNGRR